jgi:hypothetical protein
MRDFHSSRWQAIVEKFLQSSSVHTIEALASVALNEEHAEKQVPRCYDCWPLTLNVFEKSLEQRGMLRFQDECSEVVRGADTTALL